MSHFRRLQRAGCAALVALLISIPLGADELLAEAEAAFHAGDHARALELYDRVLSQEPGSEAALLHSGMLLSWERRFDEALARYDRLLAGNPHHERAALERAKVLSWDRRFGPAAEAFREILARRPDDDQARLALARTLSWSGNQEEARAIYSELLAADPRRVEALVGTAQTHAWSGRLDEARDWYRKALEVAPDDRDAEVGLAYAELWSGRTGEAIALAESLASRHPENEDVQELAKRARQARGPWVHASAERIDDTDDNRLTVGKLIVGWTLPGRFAPRLELARYDMEDPAGDAQIDSLSAGFDLRPLPTQLLVFRLGVDRLEDRFGVDESEGTGLLAYRWGVGRDWSPRLRASRNSLRYSPTITGNRIVIEELRADLDGRVGERWRLAFHGATADYSDDNRRDELGAGFLWRMPTSRPRLETGLELRRLDFDEALDTGYFDPQDFHSILARLQGSDRFGRRGYRYGFRLAAGIQSFTLDGVDTDDDAVYIVGADLDIPFGPVSLQLFGEYGDYAAQTAAGFESRQLGLRLRWRGR